MRRIGHQAGSASAQKMLRGIANGTAGVEG
jgi:hypothetical protein